MKKKIKCLLIIAFMLVFRISNVKASFINDYFNGELIYPYTECYPGRGSSGLVEWNNINQIVQLDAFCGVRSERIYEFRKNIYSENLVFIDVENPKIVSSNENIIKGEVKTYDFHYEKITFENFLEDYNKLTLDELNEELTDYGEEPLEEKPTWWEIN